MVDRKEMAMDNEVQMFGMTEAAIDAQFKWMIQTMGHEMTAISLLSDAQEVMFRGDTERARQWINVAKYILSEGMDLRRAA